MTYQIEQVQALIAEIDRVLRQPRSFRFWTYWTRLRLQKRTLERVRNFLVMQQRPSISAPAEMTSPASVLPTVASLGALSSDLEQLRLQLIQPLQTEIATLNQQRDSLLQEIRTLEARKVQILSQPQPTLDSAEVERLQALRDRTDHLLTSMDTSLHLALTSLQRNLDTYQESLAQGIDRMHGLGHQGEVLFSSLVNHLAQQLGREASAYIHAPQAEPALDTVQPTTEPETPSRSLVVSFQSSQNQISEEQTTAFPSEPKSVSNPENLSPVLPQADLQAASQAASQSDTIHNLSDLFDIWEEQGESLHSKASESPSQVGQPAVSESLVEDLTLSTMDDLFADEFLIPDDNASQVTVETLFDSPEWDSDTPAGNPVPRAIQPVASHPASNPASLMSDQQGSDRRDPPPSNDLTLDEIHAIFADAPSVSSTPQDVKSDRST
ncbi:hypothetical protein ACN4EG_11805 [Alkalinema pantanalense CENA528]|uniref:hypothetical protein n=1 Tax=Alkalinema pantanalense TaxID=1620705 RepID=UPI003D6DC60A